MPRYTLSFVAAVGLVMLVAIGLLESTVGLVLFPFTKPFSSEELVGRLRALVRRSKGYSDSRISFGPMTLDLVAKTVEAGGNRVRLSGKEYQILELLSLRRGVAVSKETLINHIYSDGEGPDSPTIGLFMCRLRKKLAAASGGQHYIQTVRDQGYRMPRAA